MAVASSYAMITMIDKKTYWNVEKVFLLAVAKIMQDQVSKMLDNVPSCKQCKDKCKQPHKLPPNGCSYWGSEVHQRSIVILLLDRISRIDVIK